MTALRSPLAWIAALVVVGLALLAVLVQREPAGVVAARRVAAPSSTARSAPVHVADPRIAQLHSASDVERFVGEVAAAATARGRVDPDDYARVRRAAEQLRGPLSEPEVQAKARRLGEELALLARRLEHKPVLDELDRLSAQLTATSDTGQRQALAERYREAVQSLPPPARQFAMDRLAAILGPS